MVTLLLLGLLAAAVVLAVVFFLFSVSSRKTYRCPQCGETVRNVEHLNAKRCGMCGARLDRA